MEKKKPWVINIEANLKLKFHKHKSTTSTTSTHAHSRERVEAWEIQKSECKTDSVLTVTASLNAQQQTNSEIRTKELRETMIYSKREREWDGLCEVCRSENGGENTDLGQNERLKSIQGRPDCTTQFGKPSSQDKKNVATILPRSLWWVFYSLSSLGAGHKIVTLIISYNCN